MERTLPKYALSILPPLITRVLDIQIHNFFHWFWIEKKKSVDLLVSEFFLYCD